MRIGNILIQPIDASDGEFFVIMDESSGAEIQLSKDKLMGIHEAIHALIGNAITYTKGAIDGG